MITITKEILENAMDYMPAEEKQLWADKVANVCIVSVDMSGKDDGGRVIPVPPRCEENGLARTFALAQALAQEYLKLYPKDKVLLEGDYEEILSSHLVNQIERMKSERDVRDKAFNILYDYGELKKMLNTSIFSKLGHLNDPLSRLLVALQAVDPNEITKATEDLNELKVAINDYQKKKKRAAKVAGETSKAAMAAEEDGAK